MSAAITALKVYWDWRTPRILLLGLMSGFPWVLIGSMLTLWLKESGFSKTDIGLFGLLFTPYALNLLWAPIVDRYIPWPFSKFFGRRISWILTCQLVIGLALIALWQLDINLNLWLVAAACLTISCASATQDIAIDALRIELIDVDEPEKLGAASALATSGWWLGYGALGALALSSSDFLEKSSVSNHWQQTYLMLLLVVIITSVLLVILLGKRTDNKPNQPTQSESNNNMRTAVIGLLNSYWHPLKYFLIRYGVQTALLLLFVIFFFKIGEAFLGRMSLVFYKEIGFSKSDIAIYSKGYGTITVVVVSLLSGIITARWGVLSALIIGGTAMASTNLLFAWLALSPSFGLFGFAVVADQITTAVSTVAFVAFISNLCDRKFTATHYAALASLGNLSRTTLSSSSGYLVEQVLDNDWVIFFIFTTFAIIPTLVIIILLRKQLAKLMQGAITKVI